MAAKDNLPEIDLNAAYKHEYEWFDEDPVTRALTPIPIDGYQGKLQIKARITDTTALVTWSTANGRLIITGNKVRIYVPYSEVITYTTLTEGVFDLLIWPPTDLEDVTCLVRGEVVAAQGITVR